MTTSVHVTAADGIGWLTFGRPETRNALDAGFVEEAVAALDRLPGGIGALVVYGEGPAFCVGADLHMFQQAAAAGRVGEDLGPLLGAMHDITRRLRALPVPTVAAVEGPAAGAAVGLASAWDLRVVRVSAGFGAGFCAFG